MGDHWHADVSENNVLNRDRSECRAGTGDTLTAAKDFLLREINDDSFFYRNESLITPEESDHDTYTSWEALRESLESYDGTTEAWEGKVILPLPGNGNTHRSVVMGYRLMWIDGACERTI